MIPKINLIQIFLGEVNKFRLGHKLLTCKDLLKNEKCLKRLVKPLLKLVKVIALSTNTLGLIKHSRGICLSRQLNQSTNFA